MPWSRGAEWTPFVQQVCVELLLCVRHCARCWGHIDIVSEQCVEMDMGFLKAPAGLEGEREKGGGAGGNRRVCKAQLPGVLLLLGGHVEAEVKLPAPLGVTGQGRHHPLAGGARRLEQPYCRHTSGQLLGEVTKRRSIHLSSGSTETRHVTPGGCLGLGPASGSVPSLLGVPHPVPALRDGAVGAGGWR